MICARCNHAVLPGQLYARRVVNMIVGGTKLASVPMHIACPNEREVHRAQMWGRWT